MFGVVALAKGAWCTVTLDGKGLEEAMEQFCTETPVVSQVSVERNRTSKNCFSPAFLLYPIAGDLYCAGGLWRLGKRRRDAGASGELLYQTNALSHLRNVFSDRRATL